MAKIDLTGKRFGKLVVIKDTGKRSNSKKIIYLCKCDCGKFKEIVGANLSIGDTNSCGCLQVELMKSRYINLIGQRFGKFMVIAETKNRKPTMFLCKCDCGTEIEVRSGDLINGESKGCRKCTNITHGMSHTRLYGIWSDMKARCYNSNSESYNYYGGRGIIVCYEWIESFMEFYDWASENGYKSNLTIDRIDVNGNYEPSNCRWATWSVQNKNKRWKQYEIKGASKSLPEWCEYANLNYGTVYQRIHKLNETLERALRLDEK